MAENAIKKAKIALLLNNPFFGNLLLRLKFEPNESIPTCRTNGVRIQYNSKFIKSLSSSLVKSVLAHEVLHLALSHHARRNNRNPEIYNQACDYVVNQILKESGFILQDDWLINPAYKGMSTEKVYKLIYQDQDDGGSEQGQNPGQNPGPGDVEDPPSSDPSRDNPTPEDVEQSDIDWQIAARQAAQQAKACGKLPGSLEETIVAQTQPTIDWREPLRDFMTDKAKKDSTWRMPNRRYAHMGLYLPSIESEDELCKALCYIDVSGSVSMTELQHIAAEINGVLEEFPNIELTCRYFDTEVKNDTLVFGGDSLPVVLPFKAVGGGTDFRPVFEDIAAAPEQPKFVIIFSDLEGPFPDTAPPYPVLWGSTSSYINTVPFGEIVRIDI